MNKQGNKNQSFVELPNVFLHHVLPGKNDCPVILSLLLLYQTKLVFKGAANGSGIQKSTTWKVFSINYDALKSTTVGF